MIPENLINPVAARFLQKYVVRPNRDMDMGMRMMGGCGMTMMGAPTVVGGGVDCNNYLDVRNERHVTDQGTARVDHNFARGDSLAARYSLSKERGFMPQNLPGFGAFHDNFSQHGSVSWNHIFNPERGEHGLDHGLPARDASIFRKQRRQRHHLRPGYPGSRLWR